MALRNEIHQALSAQTALGSRINPSFVRASLGDYSIIRKSNISADEWFIMQRSFPFPVLSFIVLFCLGCFWTWKDDCWVSFSGCQTQDTSGPTRCYLTTCELDSSSIFPQNRSLQNTHKQILRLWPLTWSLTHLASVWLKPKPSSLHSSSPAGLSPFPLAGFITGGLDWLKKGDKSLIIWWRVPRRRSWEQRRCW